ncbi:hypothetical protein ABZS76_16830 [Streptomyces sp. NPDC005562]|uniref:hypothetical protein n=1 Tax=Streptomyces sp. NPDC005562 TaxID=3154890 RepID=UPI0033A158B7
MSDSYAGPEAHQGESAPPQDLAPQDRALEEPSYDPAATGDADVDAALARLGDADHLATDGHIEVYEDVHRGLRDALTALDARPGPPAPSGAPTPSYDRS